jgi:alkanesulfonate monooxygenase SsuD/methylene tetrahydromethanopterin reductase-like flavin-dependent oxidoreductase (luciferase family)
VLTTWHPLHFAEDYALADVLTGGRRLCGLGRGTEERESPVFGVNVGYQDSEESGIGYLHS